MKRIKKVCLIFICLLVFGISYNVKADNINYYLSNKDNNYEYVSKDNVKVINVKRGDSIVVSAIINNTNSNLYKIDGGKLTIRWDSKYLSLLENNGKYYDLTNSNLTNLNVESTNKEANKLVLNGISAEGVKSGKNIILEFRFKVVENANTGSNKIYQMDGEDTLSIINTQDESKTSIESLYSEIKLNVTKSTENRLSNIKISGIDLEYFNENTNDYDIEVDSDVEEINISATPKDSKAKISGNYGKIKLSYGLNKLVINVISEAETRNTYTLNITRSDDRSSVNTLSTLTLSSGEIIFKPEVTDYTVNVDNNVDKITITSSLTDSKSRYKEDYRNKEISLTEGSNKVQITIVSEKNEERTYTININRALSGNNSLKSLKVNDEKIDLKENEFIYNLIFENDIDSVIITAIANDPKATVELKDNYPLQEGENEINISVVAANGDKASYILNITRSKVLSKDSLLKNLKIKNHDINFKQDVTLYNLTIDDDENELEIYTQTEDENATVEIEGNKNLENGSIIKINVKAEDGTFTRYFINIEKGSKGISPVIIIIIVLLLLLGACLAIIFIRKKKQKEKEETKELDKNPDNLANGISMKDLDTNDHEDNEISKENVEIKSEDANDVNNSLPEEEVIPKKNSEPLYSDTKEEYKPSDTGESTQFSGVISESIDNNLDDEKKA